MNRRSAAGRYSACGCRDVLRPIKIPRERLRHLVDRRIRHQFTTSSMMRPAMGDRPARILIVDDEFSIRDSLYNWFRKKRYEVTAAENANEALDAVKAQRYDVALLDIKMPGMDGLGLQEQIHRMDPRIAVIMITAFASLDSAVEALHGRVDDFFPKPVRIKDLKACIARLLTE